MERRPLAPGALVAVARDEIVAAVRAAQRTIEIASPFLSFEIAVLIAEAAGGGPAERRFLTP